MILENLRRFGRLPRQDKKVVIRTICGAIATRIALRVFGFGRRGRLLQPCHTQAAVPSSDTLILDRARRIAHLQFAGERHLFFRPSCLEHSLVLQRLLAQEGIPARLRLGGRKDGDQFKAHAWIEVNEASFDNFNEPGMFAPFGSIAP